MLKFSLVIINGNIKINLSFQDLIYNLFEVFPRILLI